MRRRNKIDIGNPRFLHIQKNVGKTLRRNLFAVSTHRNVKVLTKPTFEVAPCKENRSTATGAGYARFFPIVCGYTGKDNSPRTAKTLLNRSLHTAISRTKVTIHLPIIVNKLLFGKYFNFPRQSIGNTVQKFLLPQNIHYKPNVTQTQDNGFFTMNNANLPVKTN